LFRHLLQGDDGEAVDVYRVHIMARTGGAEPGSWKAGVEDYVRACGDLLASMSARGFDASSPVVVGSNGRMRAGAHRAACSIALGIAAVVRHVDEPGRARPWDADDLRRGGLPAAAIDRARSDLERLRDEDCRCHCPAGHGAPQGMGHGLC
jgi:hypothetical protein